MSKQDSLTIINQLPMNIFYRFLIIALLSCGFTQVSAQVLAQWQFENPIDSGTNPSTAPTSTSAGITASNAATSGITSTVAQPGSTGGAPNANTYSYHSFGWPTQPVPNRPASGTATVDPGKYYEYTVAANDGCTVTIQAIQMSYRAVNGSYEGLGGSAYYVVRSSHDGFITNLNRSGGFGPITEANANYNSATFRNAENPTELNLPGQPGITFRVYYYNVLSSTAEVEMDRVRIFGQVTCPTAMPVAFNSFTGKAAGNQVQLSWETSWERNAHRFDIERSQDAAEFGSIGQVRAVGNATQKQFYGFTDEQALSGVNYYRLRQVDRDGSVQYSKIIAVNTNPDKPAIMVMGNPTEAGRINLQLFNLEASQLQLFDMQGHPIAFRTRESTKGAVTLEPDNSLRNGMYLIKAANVPAAKILIR